MGLQVAVFLGTREPELIGFDLIEDYFERVLGQPVIIKGRKRARRKRQHQIAVLMSVRLRSKFLSTTNLL